MKNQRNSRRISAVSRRDILALLAAGGLALAARNARGERAPEPLRTRITEGYGVKYPFVSAGMAFVGMPPLAAAVTNAGGIGMLGVAPNPPPLVQMLIRATRELTDGLFGVNFIHAGGGPNNTVPFTTDQHIQVCIDEEVELVTFHWDLPPREWVAALQRAGARVWMQVGSVQQALAAVGIGMDAVVAQGIEAGGHNRSVATTFDLVRAVVRALKKEGTPVPVLASGGIADGRGVVKALASGAEGVWVGTRLVASEEAYAHDTYKEWIVEAGEGDTVRTTIFGPEWPGASARVLRNRVVNQWAGRENEIPFPPPPPAVIGATLFLGAPYAMPKFSAILPTPDVVDEVSDFEEMCMVAGESVALIDDVLPAGDIVRGMMEDARRRMEGR